MCLSSHQTDGSSSSSSIFLQEEFSHPVESLALTLDEIINVRRVLVKAEMEKYLQSKELYSNLKRGKVAALVSLLLLPLLYLQ